MPWFKVDDQLAFNPKVLEAGNAAMGLWVRAGSWCAANLTDGNLPRAMIAPLGGRQRDANTLVESGLWGRTEAGFRFVGWEEFQPTKAEVLRERAETAERVRKHREGKRNGVTNTVSNGSGTPAPSRPDPTEVTKVTSIDRRTTKINKPLPKDWTPTPEHQERANEYGLDINREAIKFQSHAEEKGRLAKNWNAAFTRWLTNAHEYQQRDTSRTQQGRGFSIDRRGDLLKQEGARIAATYQHQQDRLEIEQ